MNTVTLIASNPPCKNDNGGITSVSIKPLSNQKVEDIVVFLGLKVFYSDNLNLKKQLTRIFTISHWLRADYSFLSSSLIRHTMKN